MNRRTKQGLPANGKAPASLLVFAFLLHQEGFQFLHLALVFIGEESINTFINSENGLSMILFYLDLNDEGQAEAVKRIWELSEIPYYQRTETPAEPLAEDGQGKSSTEQEKPSAGQ